MPIELENSSNSASASSDHKPAPTAVVPKKKRNLPGMPDPDAEVIALSPRTLMATNRFVCEICSKGFQRDQNLQLHRRGHNLPWKLRQRTGKEPRKRVYVCPEPGCVHHEPSRALGDLTGIKKHFCRKHGEKKWKCDRCSKKYAVQSDWKAHSKTCGTREYRCDCGTLFSRRDSFVTHRAFCDALAEESAKTKTVTDSEENAALVAPPVPETQEPEAAGVSQYLPQNTDADAAVARSAGSGASVFASLFSSAAATNGAGQSTAYSEFMGSMNGSESTSLSLSTTAPNPNSTLFLAPPPPQPSPHMSATALLQKAAEMGAAASGSSFLCGFGLARSSSSSSSSSSATRQEESSSQWGGHDPGLGLGLAYNGGNLTMGPSSAFFGPKPATLDLLGLGIGPGGSTTRGFSALITSMGPGRLDVGPDASPRQPPS